MKKSKQSLVSFHLRFGEKNCEVRILIIFFVKSTDSGVCRRLVELLMNPQPSVVSAALRAVGNIVTGDDVQTQVILNCSVLPCLLNLLGASKESIRKEACWTISNITAGNREQIQAVIDANIFPVLIDILQRAEFKTRKEAAWAITNATSGGKNTAS